MPELPEVETTRRGITPAVLHQTVEDVIIRAPKLRWPIQPDLGKILKDRQLKAIERRGKYLLLYFDHGALILHLGMSGRLRILSKVLPAEKHDHADFCFNNGAIIRYTDPRRFGAILWTQADSLEHVLLAKLGPEPLTSQFTGAHLYARAQNKKVSVKVFIMDARIVVGVGNIYASEALFAAKIDPRKSANLITLEEYVELAKHIKRILKLAIEKGGTTLRDFFTAEGRPGYFSQKLQVYGRDTKPCLVCNSPIQALMLGQRNTFFCITCQK